MKTSHSADKLNLKGLSRYRYLNKRMLKPMTYIIGARCRDGVVLIGDRKVTGGAKKYTDKIRQLQIFPNIIFTAAGIESLFEEFLETVQDESSRYMNKINQYNQANPSNPKAFTTTDFKHICVKKLKKMKIIYSEIEDDIPFELALQVLFVVPENRGNAIVHRLYSMNMSNCYPILIDQGKFIPIGVSDIGNVFLKNLEMNNEFGMKEVARVGSFIIKYIEKENLHDGIGVGEKEPQVWFVEDNNSLPKEIDGEELKNLLEGVDGEVVNIIKKLGSSSMFLRHH